MKPEERETDWWPAEEKADKHCERDKQNSERRRLEWKDVYQRIHPT